MMSETNKERVGEFVKIFVDRLEGHGIHIPFWAHNGLYTTVLDLVSEAEKRGRQEARASYLLENCYLTDDAELICERPQLDADKIWWLISDLGKHAKAYGYQLANMDKVNQQISLKNWRHTHKKLTDAIGIELKKYADEATWIE